MIDKLTSNSVSVEERYFIAMNQMYSDLEELERSNGDADREIELLTRKSLLLSVFRTEDGYNIRYLIEVSVTNSQIFCALRLWLPEFEKAQGNRNPLRL
jgi:hypothetical protein